MELLDKHEDSASCMFKYPSDCSDDCQYFASWQMQEDAVKFYVASTDLDKWIGIGISSNSFMVKFLQSGEIGRQFIFFSLEPE